MKLVVSLVMGVFISSALAVASSSGSPHFSNELYHGGGTDKCGCHYNRKTGEYHCHNRKKRGGDCPP